MDAVFRVSIHIRKCRDKMRHAGKEKKSHHHFPAGGKFTKKAWLQKVYDKREEKKIKDCMGSRFQAKTKEMKE